MRCLPLVFLVGCGTLSGARPLQPGQHEVGVVLGGPLIEFAGAPIPIPNLMLAGRSGVGLLADRPLDLAYGMNLTGLPFGVLALQGDVGWLLADQQGARPAFTVRNAVAFTSNAFASDKSEDAQRAIWVVDQLSLLASWKVKENVFYLSVAQATDLSAPSLVLTPGLGVSLDPGDAGGLRYQVDLSWYGINRSPDLDTIGLLPSKPGAIGVHLGLAYGFGGAK